MPPPVSPFQGILDAMMAALDALAARQNFRVELPTWTLKDAEQLAFETYLDALNALEQVGFALTPEVTSDVREFVTENLFRTLPAPTTQVERIIFPVLTAREKQVRAFPSFPLRSHQFGAVVGALFAQQRLSLAESDALIDPRSAAPSNLAQAVRYAADLRTRLPEIMGQAVGKAKALTPVTDPTRPFEIAPAFLQSVIADMVNDEPVERFRQGKGLFKPFTIQPVTPPGLPQRFGAEGAKEANLKEALEGVLRNAGRDLDTAMMDKDAKAATDAVVSSFVEQLAANRDRWRAQGFPEDVIARALFTLAAQMANTPLEEVGRPPGELGPPVSPFEEAVTRHVSMTRARRQAAFLEGEGVQKAKNAYLTGVDTKTLPAGAEAEIARRIKLAGGVEPIRAELDAYVAQQQALKVEAEQAKLATKAEVNKARQDFFVAQGIDPKTLPAGAIERLNQAIAQNRGVAGIEDDILTFVQQQQALKERQVLVGDEKRLRSAALLAGLSDKLEGTEEEIKEKRSKGEETPVDAAVRVAQIRGSADPNFDAIAFFRGLARQPSLERLTEAEQAAEQELRDRQRALEAGRQAPAFVESGAPDAEGFERARREFGLPGAREAAQLDIGEPGLPEEPAQPEFPSEEIGGVEFPTGPRDAAIRAEQERLEQERLATRQAALDEVRRQGVLLKGAVGPSLDPNAIPLPPGGLREAIAAVPGGAPFPSFQVVKSLEERVPFGLPAINDPRAVAEFSRNLARTIVEASGGDVEFQRYIQSQTENLLPEFRQDAIRQAREQEEAVRIAADVQGRALLGPLRTATGGRAAPFTARQVDAYQAQVMAAERQRLATQTPFDFGEFVRGQRDRLLGDFQRTPTFIARRQREAETARAAQERETARRMRESELQTEQNVAEAERRRQAALRSRGRTVFTRGRG